MRQFRVLVALAAYLVLALAPLGFSFMQLDPGRGFWVNLSVGAGFVGLSMMGLQFVLAARISGIAGPLSPDTLLKMHRQLTILITVLIFAHPIILFFWDARFLELLNVFTSPLRAKFAVLSVVALILLIVMALCRKQLRISYVVWQGSHTLLAAISTVAAMLHVLLIGYYVEEMWEKALWIAYTVVFIAIGVWVRVIRPLLRWRQRWEVVEVVPDVGDAHRIVLRPANPRAFAAAGFRFAPGQFAWIHVGRHPFALTYHPFSFSSSAQDAEQIAFTIKAEGQFTREIAYLKPGKVAYLDGPWGHLSYRHYDAPGYVFLAAGVGVTPMLSMLETLADEADQRPLLLLLGNRHEQEIIGREQLEALEQRLPNLRIVHAISRPSEGWTGYIGRVDAALLDQELPAQRGEYEYFLCASDAAMTSMQDALKQLGISSSRIHLERFMMV